MKFKTLKYNYCDNCHVCKKCTDPDFDKKDIPLCPICKSDKARIKIVPGAHWKTNIVECENLHEYDILNFCDEKDIKLHQDTIDKMNKVK